MVGAQTDEAIMKHCGSVTGDGIGQPCAYWEGVQSRSMWRVPACVPVFGTPHSPSKQRARSTALGQTWGEGEGHAQSHLQLTERR